jgi:hypothetical protein
LVTDSKNDVDKDIQNKKDLQSQTIEPKEGTSQSQTIEPKEGTSQSVNYCH